MADDSDLLERLWAAEETLLRSGPLDETVRTYVAFAVSLTNAADASVRRFRDRLKELGATQEELFEAFEVVQHFNMDNAFATGLMLEPTADQRPDRSP